VPFDNLTTAVIVFFGFIKSLFSVFRLKRGTTYPSSLLT
jgi:hypothetical protein